MDHLSSQSTKSKPFPHFTNKSLFSDLSETTALDNLKPFVKDASLPEIKTTSESETIYNLTKQGRWKHLASYMQFLLTRCEKTQVEVIFQLWTIRIASILKLKEFVLAKKETDGLFDLYKESFRYEDYPDVFDQKIGSFVPFEMFNLWIKAPYFLEKYLDCLGRLEYVLGKNLNLNISQIKEFKLIKIKCLINLHEYNLAIEKYNQLIEETPQDVELMYEFANFYLSIGDNKNAKSIYDNISSTKFEIDKVSQSLEIENPKEKLLKSLE